MRNRVKAEIRESAGVIGNLPADDITAAADLMVKSLKAGGKLLLCGNGGSAADSQHIAAELVGRFKAERDPIPALALTTDTSILTALANDYGAETMFSRQVAALGRAGDVLVALSTSGSSPNVLAAVDAARKMGLNVVGFTGAKGGRLRDKCDVCITAPSEDTPRIQEAHITCAHIICGLLEEAFTE